MNNRRTLLSAAIAMALAAPAMAGINDIIISEYVEGSYDNKAVEIRNNGTAPFTFTADHALYYANESSGNIYNNIIENPAGGNVLEGVTIAAGDVVVIAHGDANAELKSAVTANGSRLVEAANWDQGRYNSMNFSGDDAVFIADASDASTVYDMIGVAKKGNNWGKDTTLRRFEHKANASAVYDPTAWASETKDTFSGLGDSTLPEKPADPLNSTVGEIQGEGFSSPLLESGEEQTKDTYRVSGVVTAVATNLVKGFYIYHADGNPLTSDGLFVQTNVDLPADFIAKDVTVIGKVREADGMTTLSALEWTVNGDAAVPAAFDLQKVEADGEDFQKTLERFEGMLVNLPTDVDPATPDVNEDMRVSRSFSHDFDAGRSNMVLSYKRPNMQPNQEHIAGSQESMEHAEQNNNYRLIVESDEKAPDGQIPYYSGFSADAQSNYIRINDSVVGLEGVVHYLDDNFRLIPTNTVNDSNFTHNTDRTEEPTLDESTAYDQFAVRLATLNVLNYFNSPYGGEANQFGDNRGARSEIEFERQQAKLVEAVFAMDADIVGLMEIENNGFSDRGAITQFVNAINANYWNEDYSDRHYSNSIHNKYVFIGFDSNGDTVLDGDDSIGSDAITSGLIYRPSKVSLESARILAMPRQVAPAIVDDNGQALVDKDGEIRENGKNYNRDTVAATFKVVNTGKKLTVAVNHFKSKGSTCWEDWQGWENWSGFDSKYDDVKDPDFQGSCENFRVAAAVELGEQLARIGGDRVILGDLNSYGNEDPMLVLTAIPEGKAIRAARDTYVGSRKQFGADGADITRSFGYVNTVQMKDAERGTSSWSYSYNDEIGSLDHVLVTPSLKAKVLDATDWHINAAESSLFDYKSGYKSPNKDNPFYAETPYRSSDHDPALISLGYAFGETAGNHVVLNTKSSRMEVAYPINSDAVKAGDIATITFDPMPENMNGVAVPKVVLKKDGKQTVFFDVLGIDKGQYRIVMQTEGKARSVVAGSTVEMQVSVEGRDSTQPEINVPAYDGSGGSVGFWSFLSLIGLGFVRRFRK
ncbi:ExeM/NucH family extracellular endonuclease [Enterovibrio sp. ZSDZ35]|uniref:ExeM/NucH family extracellular endonuclease n=1 Tax=Enterovibrio qingdaonensis TaxID=2899818 RepID=A0ABT5QH72_9GAMM|nr:ExeM/NucH family extracellular endonuclease [Enterovibrio sp. ZSDZ35]MDD1780307.1 ExeM/NucH family extracellular endonuclease [Enterovibrio sp. ZSDZ35]